MTADVDTRLMADDSWESRSDTGLLAGFARIAKRLPEIWALRRRARRAQGSLRDYAHPLALPGKEVMVDWIGAMCRSPHRRPGTSEGHEAEEWLREELSRLGVEQVQKDPIRMLCWRADTWTLEAEGRDVPCFFVPNTGFTGQDGIEAPLVYVQTGLERHYRARDVRDKIVLVDVTFPVLPSGVLLRGLRGAYHVSDPAGDLSYASREVLTFVRQNFIGGASEGTAPDDAYWRAVRRGARGVVLVLRDQPTETNSHYGPYDGILKPLPALWVGRTEGAALRRAAAGGASARLRLCGSVAPSVMHNVWGTLEGQSEETILVTSHHDSPHGGFVEDGSGVAQVLAQAWAWARVPVQRRPRRLVFVLSAGHFYGSVGAHAFARQHPELMADARVLITLEHLAARSVDVRGRPLDRPALTVMFTSPTIDVIAPTIKALRSRPPRLVASIPSDLLGPAPTSDAMGYVLESGVPVVSWIGCPPYLLDEDDRMDKLDPDELESIAATVGELVKAFMAN
jgi:hypothetical protein